MNLEILKNLPNIPEDEKFYSGYFINKSKEELQQWNAKEFSKSSDIRSLKTKRSIQSILEKFSKYFEGLEEDKKYSFHFFVSNDASHFLNLEKSHLNIISKYHKKEFWLFEEPSQQYWEDFYFNDKFCSVYEVKGEAFQHYYFTKTKFEERDRIKLDYLREYLMKFPATLFLQCKSKLLEKMEPLVEEQSGKNKHEQLWNTVMEYENQKNIVKLDKILGEMEKSPEKFLFGNEVINGIKNYEVKQVYCFPEFRKKLENNLPKELFNFEWIIVPKNEAQVVSKLNDLRGIFAIKYF